MRKVINSALTVAVILLVLLVSCRKDETRVIPRGKLSQIYAEMLLTDQWITMTPGMRMIADTSLVYEPILEKYGYTSADYRKTVETYMDDPERYARILRSSSQILDERLRELKRELKKMEEAERETEYVSDFNAEEFFPYMFDEPYVHYYDSLSFEPDSLLQIYRLISVERKDTIYDKLVMVILSDTTVVEVADSLEVQEPEMEKDTVVRVPIIMKEDILEKPDTASKDDKDLAPGKRVMRRFKNRIIREQENL